VQHVPGFNNGAPRASRPTGLCQPGYVSAIAKRPDGARCPAKAARTKNNTSILAMTDNVRFGKTQPVPGFNGRGAEGGVPCGGAHAQYKNETSILHTQSVPGCTGRGAEGVAPYALMRHVANMESAMTLTCGDKSQPGRRARRARRAWVLGTELHSFVGGDAPGAPPGATRCGSCPVCRGGVCTVT